MPIIKSVFDFGVIGDGVANDTIYGGDITCLIQNNKL